MTRLERVDCAGNRSMRRDDVGHWSNDPKDFGFWAAITITVLDTLIVNRTLVIFSGKRKNDTRQGET